MMEKLNNRTFLINIMLLSLLVIYPLFCSAAMAASRKVVLTSEDGYRITGTYTKAQGKSGVVLLHMFKNSKESWQPLVEYLTSSGISSLAIDMRGHGESSKNPQGNDDSKLVANRDPKIFNEMHYDAEAAVRYLVFHGTELSKVGLVGASVGCSVALHTVSIGVVPVSSVVLMTPGKDYLGVASMNHIKNWPGKHLLILSSEEEKGRGAQAIFDELKYQGANLQVIDQEDIHGTNMFGEVEGVEKLIGQWLTNNFEHDNGKL